MHRALSANMTILIPAVSAVLLVFSLADAKALGDKDSLTAEHEHGNSSEKMAASHRETGGDGNSHHEEPESITSFLQVDPILFVWTLILFLIFAFLLKRLAWKPILAALEERERKVAEGLGLAEKTRTEVAELLKQQDEELARANEEAKRILEEARSQAAKQTEKIMAQARVDATKSQEQAQEEINDATEEALAQIRGAVVELSTSLAGKVVGREFDPADCRSLVEDSSG